MEMTAGGLVAVSDKMGGGQGSARKLQSDAVGEMEGQTQTEEERDERRQEGVMEAWESDRKKKMSSKHIQDKTVTEGDLMLYCGP